MDLGQPGITVRPGHPRMTSICWWWGDPAGRTCTRRLGSPQIGSGIRSIRRSVRLPGGTPSGELQAVRGAQADGTPWLAKATRTVETAASLAETDPSSAITLAYDAARFAAMAVLAQQGLRATTKGGHLAVDEAVRAQFGDAFRPFRALMTWPRPT
jgi:hypothetical protein